ATQRELDLDLIRREMLDECFAKGEMFREDCEGRCNELTHARETTHPPPSARSNLPSERRPTERCPQTCPRRSVNTKLKGKSLSVRGLLVVGLVLVIEPALPWYHFSPFWFLLGAASMAVALYNLLRVRMCDRLYEAAGHISACGNRWSAARRRRPCQQRPPG